ncbi:type I restriction-modification system subunit M [Streptomyces aureus]|uniref:type I restriction-modification system subunit M n=1 Tax=Streptomyces aureus TaxID=193461 RepID=UPI0006E321D4|nr:class I SAM-dependent DNA methyltransferase [Streptomyces aureus]
MPPREKDPTRQRERIGAAAVEAVHDVMWKAADVLRGPVDATEYKDFVLGLLFVRYLSDVFAERRAELDEELAAEGVPEELRNSLLEDRDEYDSHGILWVPEAARWSRITADWSRPDAGYRLASAVDALMRENIALRDMFPPALLRVDLDSRRLAALVDLIGDPRFISRGRMTARDTLSQVFAYFLASFARDEGKRGAESHTPQSLAQLIVEVLEPYGGRAYDPACGVGDMLVEAALFAETRASREAPAFLSVYGQEKNERTWRLARMNLAIHEVDTVGALGAVPADTFSVDQHPDLRADFVMAHPPFNVSDWVWDAGDSRWTYGVPPSQNANYAWLQHAVAKLARGGTAGVVLANSSMSSTSRAERDIRRGLMEADRVACLVALPSRLFRTTSIPACLWILTEDKSSQGAKDLTDRRGQILFVDARRTGTMADRTERVLTLDDIDRIATSYHAWRGTPSARDAGLVYRDEPGFRRSVDLAAVREQGYALVPGRYVGTASQEPPPRPRERPASLMRNLYAIFD